MCQAIHTSALSVLFVTASLIFIMTIPGGILFIAPFLQLGTEAENDPVTGPRLHD